MKHFLIFVILFSLLGCVKSEVATSGAIHGVVKDAETAQPLVGCSVMLMPTGVTTVTGTDGSFHFEDIAPDTYSVEISCYGYYSNKKSIIVSAGESSMPVDVLLTRYDPNNRLAELGAMTVSEVTFNSARLQCEVIDPGSSSVTERGFLYSETPNVTIATSTKKTVNTTDALFSFTVTGLAENTDYYVAAYAINGRGTAYSDVVTFRTGDASSVTAPTNVIYVSVAGNDGNDGSSWGKAKKTIGAAIQSATSGKQVWVSTGSYKEIVTPKDGVPVYGGFDGDETTTEARTGRTTVAGIDCNNYSAETLVDGFEATSVTLGKNVRLLNCRIKGGVSLPSGKAEMERCEVENCSSWTLDGVVSISYNAELTMISCFVRGNEEGIWNEGTTRMYSCVVANNGWGIRLHSGTMELYNCTIAANEDFGVAAQRDMSLYNCIVWNNSIEEHYLGEMDGSVSLYSCVEELGSDNSRIKFKSPSSSVGAEALDALTADWSIETGSICINAGNSIYFPVDDISTDIAGNVRVTGNSIDVGAYEW